MLGQVILQLLPHEHAVRADIDDAALREQPGHQFLDLGIDQRFAAANRNHRRAALLRGRQAILEGHHVLEAGGILANAATAGAGQIAGVERFELQHQGKPGRAQDLVLDDVTGDLDRQRERESHKTESQDWAASVGGSSAGKIRSGCAGGGSACNSPGQQESGGRDALRGIDAAAAGTQQQDAAAYCQPRNFPV